MCMAKKIVEVDEDLLKGMMTSDIPCMEGIRNGRKLNLHRKSRNSRTGKYL